MLLLIFLKDKGINCVELMKCISYLIYPSITLLPAKLKLITFINRPTLWTLMTSLAGLSTPDLTYRVRRETVRYQMTSHLWRTAAVNHCWYLHHDHVMTVTYTPVPTSDIHYRTFSSSYCWQIGPSPSTGPELRVSRRQMSSRQRHSRNRTPGILPAFLCLYYRGTASVCCSLLVLFLSSVRSPSLVV